MKGNHRREFEFASQMALHAVEQRRKRLEPMLQGMGWRKIRAANYYTWHMEAYGK